VFRYATFHQAAEQEIAWKVMASAVGYIKNNE
jgi:hypothetical protein